jgi:hypothetical protein
MAEATVDAMPCLCCRRLHRPVRSLELLSLGYFDGSHLSGPKPAPLRKDHESRDHTANKSQERAESFDPCNSQTRDYAWSSSLHVSNSAFRVCRIVEAL